MVFADAQRRSRAVITFVIAVLYVVCQVLSGPAHAGIGAKHAHWAQAAGSADCHGNSSLGHEHAQELIKRAPVDENSHSDLETAKSGACDAVCHGVISVVRTNSATFAVLAAKLLPEGEGIGASVARDRIDRPPSATTVN